MWPALAWSNLPLFPTLASHLSSPLLVTGPRDLPAGHLFLAKGQARQGVDRHVWSTGPGQDFREGISPWSLTCTYLSGPGFLLPGVKEWGVTHLGTPAPLSHRLGCSGETV